MSGGFLPMMLQSMTALAIVLALFAALVWAIRHLQGMRYPRSGEQRLEIVHRLSLDTRHHVVEIACGERRFLIGVSPEGMTPIAETAAGETDTPPAGNT